VRTRSCQLPSSPNHRLQRYWAELNARYFCGALPAIDITWSYRLTCSTGMFVSHWGPRSQVDERSERQRARRQIRLSAPLLQRQGKQEVIGTLAHEMIHQWQFDVLKRWPNHGSDFRRKMSLMIRDGLAITIHHELHEAVQALARYAWQCRQCRRVYHRHRRTIKPRYHRCGACRGSLKELPAAEVTRPRSSRPKFGRWRSPTSSRGTFRRPSVDARPTQLGLKFPTP
jgi:predicted SprT family Zn-dependent metalloprotease